MHELPRGSLFLWHDHWQVIGQLMPNRPHRHISASWLVGFDGPFQLEVEGHRRLTRGAIVAPDVIQALDPCETRLWCAQLDPDSTLWRALKPRLGDGASADIDVAPALMPDPDDTDCGDAGRSLVNAVNSLGQQVDALDPRIQQICEQLRADLPDRVEVRALAASVGLSPSRLTHLFREQVGVPLRRFLLHLKINRVLDRWEPGRSMSELAAEAGFYDQPHLVRTARSMFDALPSEYVATGRFNVCRCGLSLSP